MVCRIAGYSNSFGPSRESHTPSRGGGGGRRGGGSGRMKSDGMSKEEDGMECKEDVASILDDLLRDDVCIHLVIKEATLYTALILVLPLREILLSS